MYSFKLINARYSTASLACKIKLVFTFTFTLTIFHMRLERGALKPDERVQV